MPSGDVSSAQGIETQKLVRKLSWVSNRLQAELGKLRLQAELESWDASLQWRADEAIRLIIADGVDICGEFCSALRRTLVKPL